MPGTGPLNTKISLRISITQKAHSKIVLFNLQKFFDCGLVIPYSKDCMRFMVQRKKDIIKKIIPHFNNYPLKTSKQFKFECFKEASEIVRKKEHLELKGLKKIIEIKNKMNRKWSLEEFNLKLKKILLNPQNRNRSLEEFNYLKLKKIILNPH